MATGLLERERTSERDLRAYGKISGAEESAEMTEEQKALRFNSRISENYKKLINPEFKRAEDFTENASFDRAERQEVYNAVEAPVYNNVAPDLRAQVFTAPSYQTPVYESPRTADFSLAALAPVLEPEAPAYQENAPEYTDYGRSQEAGFSAEETADLMPTATTIQYRSDLFENEKPTVVEEKKGYSLTAKGKLLMAVYALVVAVVLALIIINTSVLKTLDSEVNAQEARLSEVTAMSRELDDRIAEYTSDEYIINWAEENGFVHR